MTCTRFSVSQNSQTHSFSSSAFGTGFSCEKEDRTALQVLFAHTIGSPVIG
jgi:hypothetical protein